MDSFATTVDEEEALLNIQRQGEVSTDIVPVANFSETEETVILEDGSFVGNSNRGDEGLLEGVAVGNIDVYSSDSDEEEDSGIVIHAGRATTPAPRRHTPHFDRSSKTYLRPQALTPAGSTSYAEVENLPVKVEVKEETKRLRFSHHRTAFDVDIENLESHPWRNKNVDLSDYFNYGFSEATWQSYSERQLLLRAKLGLGPYHPAPVVTAPPAKTETAPLQSAPITQSTLQPAVTVSPPVYAPAAILPLAISSMPPQPPRIVPTAVHQIVLPPVIINQPPPPRRAPPSVPVPEQFPTPGAPAPPAYPPQSTQPPPNFIHHQHHQGHTAQAPSGGASWTGIPQPLNVMGGAGMGWDPLSGLPSHVIPLGSYGFPQGGMMPPFGMPVGMMQGGMMMDQGMQPSYIVEPDMRGERDKYHENDRYRNEGASRGGSDGHGFDGSRRDRRYDANPSDRYSATKPGGEDDRRSKGIEKDQSREKRGRSGSRDRTGREEGSARNCGDRGSAAHGRDDDERESGKGRATSDKDQTAEDDRDRARKRRRDGDDDSASSSRMGRDRDRDRDRESDKRRR